jgi:Ser/Thr protein kinase RdoA (MazF antagonist)
MWIMREIGAAVTAATSLGVRCDDPVVLHDGSNVVVHLRPAPVVARVATLTARVRPGIAEWFRRDAEVAGHVSDRGVLATRPFAPPRVVDGHVVALWHHEPHVADHVISAAEAAAALFDLHVGLSDYTAPLPRLGPCADLDRAFPLLPLSTPVLAVLRAEKERLARELRSFPPRPLHGDAHPGNLLATPAGLMWNDFEDAWLGPLGWDLACLATSRRVDGAAAVAAYPGVCPADELATCVELRELFGVVWRFVVASRFPHRRAEADEHLERWLANR